MPENYKKINCYECKEEFLYSKEIDKNDKKTRIVCEKCFSIIFEAYN